MDSIRIQTAQNVTIEQPLAGVGDRIVAGFLDLIIQVIVALIGSSIIGALVNSSLQLWLIIGYNVLILTYHPLSELFFNGVSIGKRIMRLRVVKIDGSALGVGDVLLRWLLSLIEIFMTYGGLATLVVALNPKGQRLGDMAAGTTVIRTRNSIGQLKQNLARRPKLPDDYEPSYSNVLDLSDKEIEICRRTVRLFRLRQDRQPMELAKEMVEKRLGIESDLHPIKFMDIIEKDYVYYSQLAEEKLNESTAVNQVPEAD
jgi:uncharacterized RDD family membrane protein YckC